MSNDGRKEAQLAIPAALDQKKSHIKSPVKCISFEHSRGTLPRGHNGCCCVPADGGPQHGRGHHRCAGACTYSGHIPIVSSHASMIDTTTDPPRLSSASRANHSSHPDVSMSALNVRIRSLVCCQESMAILWLSTVDFEFKARGGKVSSQPALLVARTHPPSPVSRPSFH